ncbi:MAG: hypothetical protein IJ080_06225 [Oscillospiraceae bacterium]|nr:hypothetical protein [Oscillospiraceae bacterium]
MKNAHHLLFTCEARRLPVYLSVYIFPLLIYLQTGYSDDVTVRHFFEICGMNAVIAWNVLLAAVFVIYLVASCRAFDRELARLSAPELEELTEAVRDKQGVPVFDGRIVVTDSCLFYTGGTVIPMEEIREIIIEMSETSYLPVYHMYVYCADDERRMIRIGFRPLSYEFESLISDRIRVIRQDRPLAGKGAIRGGMIRETEPLSDDVRSDHLIKGNRKALILRTLRPVGMGLVAYASCFAVTIWVPWLEEDLITAVWIAAPSVIFLVFAALVFCKAKRGYDRVSRFFAEAEDFERMSAAPLRFGTFYLFDRYLYYPDGFLIVPYDEITDCGTSYSERYSIPLSAALIISTARKKYTIPIVKWREFMAEETEALHTLGEYMQGGQ